MHTIHMIIWWIIIDERKNAWILSIARSCHCLGQTTSNKQMLNHQPQASEQSGITNSMHKWQDDRKQNKQNTWIEIWKRDEQLTLSTALSKLASTNIPFHGSRFGAIPCRLHLLAPQTSQSVDAHSSTPPNTEYFFTFTIISDSHFLCFNNAKLSAQPNAKDKHKIRPIITLFVLETKKKKN